MKRVFGVGLVLLLFGVAIAGSFNGSAGESTAIVEKKSRLATGWESPEQLVARSLEAFAARDTAALEAMMITSKEFAEILYPEFGMHYPAARDQRVEARDFIWANHTGSSAKGLRKALRELGGKQLRLEHVVLPTGGTPYTTYTIYEDPQITVVLEDGSTADMMALGSIVEIDGRYKLLSFRDRN